MLKAIHGITVAHFFESYREKLKLELVTGEAGLHRIIREGTINRPALALNWTNLSNELTSGPSKEWFCFGPVNMNCSAKPPSKTAWRMCARH